MIPLLEYRPFDWWVSNLTGKKYDDALQFVVDELEALPPDVENMIWGGYFPKAPTKLLAFPILGAEGIFEVIDLDGHYPEKGCETD
ncbi:hypothetical protein [Chitinilyticum piscinae]|uniref:Uncharacterized protein n=1 Tax=Chitinilyticum piscinae TaxID=2866724 RepID=A0A8J7FS92_9NEIS|nr:hypothetical protein [Chitinilyticum piscinae]MBE9611039.1 hypothetical protein [Chitinilyticum piscinae]